MDYYIIVHYAGDDDQRGVPEAGPIETFERAKYELGRGPYNNLGNAEIVEGDWLIAQYPGGIEHLHQVIALAQVSRSEDFPRLDDRG